MDYIAVYEGEEDDPSSVKLSPGKLQRAGVATEAGDASHHRGAGSCARAPSNSTNARFR